MNISNNQLIDLIFKNSHTSFVILDKNYNFLRVNESYASACGKPVDFFPGKNHFELYPSNAIDIFETIKQTKKPFSISARPFIFPNDPAHNVTYWDWNLEPVLDNDGEIELFIWSIKEVTQRVKAEKSCDHFFNLSNNMICTATFDGYFVELSPAWHKTLGFTAEELRAKPFIEFVHPDDREKTYREAEKLSTKKDETINFVNRYLTKDGTYKWLSWNSKGDADQNLIYAIAYDITELKEAESKLTEKSHILESMVLSRTEALKKVESRLRYLISNSPAVIYTCEPKGSFPATFISDNIKSIFDYEPTQFTDTPSFWANNIHPDDAPTVFENLSNLFIHDKHKHEYRFRKKNGDYIWVYDELSLIRDENNEPLEIIGYWADISSRKEMEVNLTQAKLIAENANQSKSEFLSSMSHELRTPLNAIIGFSQLISLSDIDDDIKTDVKEIHKAGKHLLNLINDILDLSKIEAGKISVSIENININDITHECLLLIDEAARSSNIHIINSLKIDEVIYIVGDHTRTKQVILNLLSNAVKYNNIDGSIKIKHEYLDDRLRISISNTGPTLDIDQQKKLFTPFERLGQENSTVEGTGIGLLVTKKLIERMNGDIGYDIDSDNNSTFWIELPLGSIQASDLLHNNTTEPERTTSNKRAGKILYIEDNQANIRLIESILKHTPHEIKSAYDGDSGLSILEQYQPDLVLLDINLPGADGYEILASIKANPNINTTPVIAVTANATKSDISKGMQAGFTHYITKPIDASEFLNTVEQYI